MNMTETIGAGFIAFLFMISLILNLMLISWVYRLGRMVDLRDELINALKHESVTLNDMIKLRVKQY